MLYEFINPSDHITFEAETDQLAFFAAALIGGGKAGYEREDGGPVAFTAMTAFSQNADEIYEKALGMEPMDFLEANSEEIAEVLESFMYGGFSDYLIHQKALQAISDEESKGEFLALHEEKKRTSCNQFVKYAWDMAGRIRNNSNQEDAA